jgi:hypothetical protein
MWILVKMFDTTRIETTRAPQHAMDGVTLLQEQFGKVRAVLASDPGDQRNFRHAIIPSRVISENWCRVSMPIWYYLSDTYASDYE